mgnify:CR=1 FL=1
MRADRLLQIMILLQNNGKMTTRQLAESLEVSERTILRDMDALSASGIPVTAERGKSGGWKLIDRFRSSVSGLKLDELKSLFILPSDQLLDQLGIRPGGLEIRRKLAASMPQAVKNSAQQYLEKIYIDTGTWKPSGSELTETLRQVQSALWEDRTIRIQYQKANGEFSERVVCPMGLVAKGNVWYLVAMNGEGISNANRGGTVENSERNERGGGWQPEYRSYRISRIRRAEIQPESFARPEPFNLAAYWKESKQQFAASLPHFEVKVLVDPAIVNRITFTDKFLQKAEIGKAEGGGMVPAMLHFDSEEEAVEYVLGFGGKMKIVQPEDLIPLVIEQARAAIALYADSPSETAIVRSPEPAHAHSR